MLAAVAAEVWTFVSRSADLSRAALMGGNDNEQPVQFSMGDLCGALSSSFCCQ